MKDRILFKITCDIERKLWSEDVDEPTSSFDYEDTLTLSDGTEIDYEASVNVYTEYERPDMDYFNGTGIQGGYFIAGATATITAWICADGERGERFDFNDINIDL